MLTALNVGNNILKRAFGEEIDITPMKLQKLIYLVYKQYYKLTKQSLFGERFEVWKYGPVVRSVYDEFKHNGANRIKAYAQESDGTVLIGNEETSLSFKEALDHVWNIYKNIDGIRLSEMTHRKDTAWYKAAKTKSSFLSDEDIEAEEEFIHGA